MTTNLEKIRILKHLESLYLNRSEESGALIYRVEDVYVLFEIPAYGGEPRYYDTFHEGDEAEMIKTLDGWI